MKQSQLILTSDYEIFGNGSGDILNCLIKPTNQMMDIAEEFGHSIKFYVDVCEIWSFENEKDYKGHDGISAYEHVSKQLLEIKRRGHDIQLHLHPQWIGARYEKHTGQWHLNYQYWRLPTVKDLQFENHGSGVKGILSKGKFWLENFFQKEFPEYKCEHFRAGAWCIQPEYEVIKALKELHFKTDSTVAPGMKYKGNLTYFDFQKLSSYPTEWKIGNSLDEIDLKSELLEVSISTAKTDLLNQLYFAFLKRIRKNPSKAPDSNARNVNSESSNFLEKFKRYIIPSYRMLDFASGSTFEEMRFITNKHLAKQGLNSKVVMISHPKNFGSSTEFRKFLKWWEGQ